ncbi:MAG: ammonia-forming cytochrome c nitrite reductase subunit c552 [Betaproteobacteria bacterium]
MRPWTIAIILVVVAVAAIALLAGRPGGFRLAEPTPGAPSNPSNAANPAPTTNTSAQLKASAHSRITPSEPPLHTRDGCVLCHTGPGFAKQTNKAAEVSAQAIGCNDCHDFGADNKKEGKLRIVGKVTLPNKKAVDAGTAATCMTCHNSRRDIADPTTLKDSSAPHYGPQAEILRGTNAVEYPGTKYTNSAHTALADSCVTCHMAAAAGNPNDAGGHSMRMKTKDGKANLNACRPCHADIKSFDRTAYGDYDGDGTLEGLQTEVDGLLATTQEAIVKLVPGATKISHAKGKIVFEDSAGKPVATSNQKALQAAWNWLLVELDKSRGIHNPAYTVQVLQSTYKAVTGQDVPGATIR